MSVIRETVDRLVEHAIYYTIQLSWRTFREKVIAEDVKSVILPERKLLGETRPSPPLSSRGSDYDTQQQLWLEWPKKDSDLKEREKKLRKEIEEREDRFAKGEWESRLKTGFETKLTEALTIIGEKFIRRYSWCSDNNLLYSFLIMIRERLLEPVKNPLYRKGFAVYELTIDQLTKFAVISDADIDILISAYPYSQENFRQLIGLRLPSVSTKVLDTTQCISRLDLYRLLNTNYSDKTLSISTGELGREGKVTRYAPMRLDELPKLRPTEKAAFECLLVNVNSSETDTSWVLLNKVDGRWQCYIPAGYDPGPIQDTINRSLGGATPVAFIPVDYLGNTWQNELAIPSEKIWQYVLLGRVLPYCHQIRGRRADIAGGLESFRATVPVDRLFEMVGPYLYSEATKASSAKSALLVAKQFTDRTAGEYFGQYYGTILGTDSLALLERHLNFKETGLEAVYDQASVAFFPSGPRPDTVIVRAAPTRGVRVSD